MAQGSLAALLRGDPAPKPTATPLPRERSRSPRPVPEPAPEPMPEPVAAPVECPKAWRLSVLKEIRPGLQCGLPRGACGLVAGELHAGF